VVVGIVHKRARLIRHTGINTEYPATSSSLLSGADAPVGDTTSPFIV
jgi:hypothetical protein